MNPGRVVVTGAAGFVGRHVARRFAEADWQVVGVGHGTWSADEARSWGLAEWHAADITFDALVNSGLAADAVIHCAGSGSVGYSMTHPLQDFHRSCVSIAASLEYARLHAPQVRIVYLSSAAVYGQRCAAAIPESAPLAPTSPYGFHKTFGESLCQMYGAHYGISTAVIRFFSVYGRGLRKQLLWDACSKSLRGDTQFGGTGEETRDWVYVTDAAELVFRALEWANPARAVINGGTGEAPTVRAVLSELLQRLGVASEPRFSGVARPGDPKHYRADVSAVFERGWTPKVNWRDGVCAYADWYRSEQP